MLFCWVFVLDNCLFGLIDSLLGGIVLLFIAALQFLYCGFSYLTLLVDGLHVRLVFVGCLMFAGCVCLMRCGFVCFLLLFDCIVLDCWFDDFAVCWCGFLEVVL